MCTLSTEINNTEKCNFADSVPVVPLRDSEIVNNVNKEGKRQRRMEIKPQLKILVFNTVISNGSNCL